MTFDVGEVINYMIDGFLRAPIVSTIAKNPIYTALVITAIIMLIIMIIFRDIDADETLFTMALRSGFWIFIMMLGILMIHNRVLGAESQTKSVDGQYETVFTPSVAGRLESDFVPVQYQGRGMQNAHTQSPTSMQVPMQVPTSMHANTAQGFRPGSFANVIAN
jgi:uncharacterized membrane protein YhaH (DUF805 family)